MSTLLLNRILNCKEYSNLIVIEDTILQSGYALLLEFIKRLTKKPEHSLVLVCLEYSPRNILEHIKTRKNIIIIDAYTQIASYEDENVILDKPIINSPKGEENIKNIQFVNNLENLSLLTNIIKDTLSNLSKSSQYSIIIDSINPLLISSSNSSTISFLRKLSNDLQATTLITVKNKKQFIKDSSPSTSSLGHIISSYMNCPYNGICSIQHKKYSGKIIYEDFQDTNTADQKIIANLSFDLSLTEKQKKAKENVVLPYLKVQTTDSSSNFITTGGDSLSGGLITDDFF
ncbi:12469_t:CDS:2 [Entrophospora sp. SA101]|nr:12469_t:CDS:2 [Entrophospora sp. SA101]